MEDIEFCILFPWNSGPFFLQFCLKAKLKEDSFSSFSKNKREIILILSKEFFTFFFTKERHKDMYFACFES